MTTFSEFREVVRLSAKDKSSGKRMRQITKVLRETKILRSPTPERAVKAAEKLGPTFVKIGQIASNRSDIIPKDYCEALAKLRSHVPAMSFDTVLELIEQSYGHPWQETFASIDEKPLGSASIAQVHKAVLHDGSVVAIKVRRPGIVDTMHSDIMLMRRILAMAEFMTPAVQELKTAAGLIDELERTTIDELDFSVELSNLSRFYLDMEKQEGVFSPLPYPQISTKEILVMEYVEGSGICSDAVKALGEDVCHNLGMKLTESYVTQIIDNGFFHADPHPGNVQVRDGQLVWIDLGMVGRLTPSQRSVVGKMFMAIASSNVYDLKEALFSIARPTGDVDHGRLLEDMEAMLSQYGTADVENLNVGQAFVDLSTLLSRHNIALPAALTMLGRGFLTLEGVLEEIAPKVSLVEVLSRHVQEQLMDVESATEKAKSLIMSGLTSAQAAARLPLQASNTIDMLQKGQLGVAMNVTVPKKIMGDAYTLVGRLALALIASALFIGSAMMTTASSAGPEILNVPVLAYLGFLGSFVLSMYVILSIMRTRHQLRNDLDLK